jgi:hypothetical protein
MAGEREFGELAYTLTSLLVASYNPITALYGVPEVVADGQMLVGEAEADTDKLTGYGVYTAGLTVAKGAKVSVKAGGIDFSALTVMTGIINAVTGASGSQKRRAKYKAGGNGLPYFGIIGVGAVDGGGVAVVGFPKVKLDTYPKYELNGETNKFNISETAGYAFTVQGTDYFFVTEQHETIATWTPPATGAEFKTWMTA